MAAEEPEVAPSVEEQQAVAVTSGDNKDLTTAEGHLGAYGGYGAGLGYGNGLGYGLYGAGHGGLGYGHGAGYGGDE